MSKKEIKKASESEAKADASEADKAAPAQIELGDPVDIRPKNLPLIVKLPANASPAQKEYAKVLNAYAYQNPEKYEIKKAVLKKRLESLKGKDVDTAYDRKLSLNKSTLSFSFLKTPNGEVLASSASLPEAEE